MALNLPVRCKAGESAVHSADCSETETHIHANKQKVSVGVNLYFAIQTGRKKEKERISQRSLEKTTERRKKVPVLSGGCLWVWVAGWVLPSEPGAVCCLTAGRGPLLS